MLQLTPNQRLATFLGKSAVPWTSWIAELWKALLKTRAGDVPVLLTRFEQTLLWERIVADSEQGSALLRVPTTARLASEAWDLCKAWRLPVLDPWGSSSEDIRAYLSWSTAYQQLCQSCGWIDERSIVDVLTTAIRQGDVLLPIEIQLVGFFEYTPQLKHFLDCLADHGTHITESSVCFEEAVGTHTRVGAPDSTQEVYWAAHQATAWLARSEEVRIGIVVPNLEQRRSEIIRICHEVLAPHPVNVAAPLPLSKYPLIDAALLCLECVGAQACPLEKWSQLLRSPFLGGACQERSERAALDSLLRQRGESAFTWEPCVAWMSGRMEQISSVRCTDLLSRVQAICVHRRSWVGQKSAADWGVIFQTVLSTLGWPGERTLNSEEYQLKSRWDPLLSEYIKLDHILGCHSYFEGVSVLERLVRETPFLPQSPVSSIHVLGVLEAVGIPFDSVWVLGLHQEQWPCGPAPNPFIPISLQHQYQLPRSSAHRELAVAKRLTHALKHSGREVVFSYPLTLEDRTVQASSLLLDMPEQDPNVLVAWHAWGTVSKVHDVPPCQRASWHPQQQGPVVGPDEPIAGGAKIVDLQMACPFRAFSEIRLGAVPWVSPTLGLTPAERGQLLHRALFLFFQTVTTRQTLEDIAQADLFAKIQEAVLTALKEWRARRPGTLTPHYFGLEQARMISLLEQLVALEKTRSDFTIEAQEVEHIFTWGNLQIRCRIDRIDRLADGRAVILDYKTGKINMAHWFGERPRAAQLPLYSLTQEDDLAGIVFISLRAQGIRFQGISDSVESAAGFPGVQPLSAAKRWGAESDWMTQRQVWRETVETTIGDFAAGRADVDPRDGDATCRLCQLHPVCRIFDQSTDLHERHRTC